jgi:MFS family permease
LAPRVHAALGGLGMSPQTMTIVLLGVLLAVFQFFNVVVLATYYYLIADVVPPLVIGKFTSLYKVVGALGGVIFNHFIFKYADTHQWQIYLGCAAVYVAAFMLMGWRVKEGEYPPPEPLAQGGGGAIAAGARWLEESFAIRFYQKLYLIGLFYWAAYGAFIFQQMYALNDLGISKAAAGDAFAWAGLLTLPLFFILGPLSDRFHPVRMVTIGMALLGLCSLACFFFIQSDAMRPVWDGAWAHVRPHPSLVWVWTRVLGAAPAGDALDTKTFYAAQFTLWTTVWTVGQTMYYGAQISLLPRILPREQYGQYCAANNTLCAIAQFGAPWLCGWLIVKLGYGYRFNYLWSAACGMGGTVACVAVYRQWKRLGGDTGYVPPRLERMPAFDVVAPAPIADPGELAVPGVVAVEAAPPPAQGTAPARSARAEQF